MKEFIELLDFLGWDANETMQYGYRVPGEQIQWFRKPVSQAIVHLAKHIDRDIDMWFGINPVQRAPAVAGKARASSKEVTRVVSTYLDLDFKEGGLWTEKNALTLIENILETLETGFCATVHTGGGVQVYLPLSEEKSKDVTGAHLTVKRVHLLAESLAHENNLGQLDKVSDLPRIFRIPGSKNMKYEHKPRVFRVYGAIASEQEDSVKWLTKADLPLMELDPNNSET